MTKDYAKPLITNNVPSGRFGRCLTMLAAAAFAFSAVPADAACSVKSKLNRAILIELYTSEGCSDCPPADRWLAHFKLAAESGPQVVPLAFHVDYWDSLGWTDPFAEPEFDDRQRAAVERERGHTVFTPQILLNGRTLLSWADKQELARRMEAVARQPAAADIELSVEPGPAQHWRVEVSASTPKPKPNSSLYVALFENDLSSKVLHGENGGKELHHDFVVRRLAGPFPLDASGRLSRNLNLALPPDAKPRNLGVAAFVQQPQDGQALQAVSLADCHTE